MDLEESIVVRYADIFLMKTEKEDHLQHFLIVQSVM